MAIKRSEALSERHSSGLNCSKLAQERTQYLFFGAFVLSRGKRLYQWRQAEVG